MHEYIKTNIKRDMGGYGNSGAKVSKMHTVGGLWLVTYFDTGGQPYVTVCDRVGAG